MPVQASDRFVAPTLPFGLALVLALVPLSFLLLPSSFRGGVNVLFCPCLSVFPYFPFLSLVVLSSFLPSRCGGMVGYVSGVCCSPLSLLPFRPSFLSPSAVVGPDQKI